MIRPNTVPTTSPTQLLLFFKEAHTRHFLKVLETKTGWGKNDLALVFKECQIKALEETLTELERSHAATLDHKSS